MVLKRADTVERLADRRAGNHRVSTIPRGLNPVNLNPTRETERSRFRGGKGSSSHPRRDLPGSEIVPGRRDASCHESRCVSFHHHLVTASPGRHEAKSDRRQHPGKINFRARFLVFCFGYASYSVRGRNEGSKGSSTTTQTTMTTMTFPYGAARPSRRPSIAADPLVDEAAVEWRFSSVAGSLGHAVVAQHQVAQGAEYDEERQEDGRVCPEWKTGTPGAALALEDRGHRYRRRVSALLELAWLRASADQNGAFWVNTYRTGLVCLRLATSNSC